jgi:aspartyl-tRNA(Asn)/glutamyl-tRNA(Gln) amidotransferase subunit A
MTTRHTDLADVPATELLRLYRSKTVSPVEATRAALARIERFDPVLNAYCLVDADAALAMARESEARWQGGRPLGSVDGVPTSIKDLTLTRGWPTRRGSLAVDPNQPWEDDAPCVARLREHGAVLLGKTTTPEFGWKGTTDSPLTGITRNPWNPAMTTGGSSGGAAAAAATGMGALAQGSDAGGSIRIPASFCGIYGLKPTFGTVPAWPPSLFGNLAHLGPMTRTVADAALMMNVIARSDVRDWNALPDTGRDYLSGLDDGVRGLRIAFSPTLGYAQHVDPEVAAAVAQAAQAFAELGAHVETVDPPIEYPGDIFAVLYLSGTAFLATTLSPEQRAVVDPGLARLMEEGERIGAQQLANAQYARGALGVAMQRFFERHDLLLTPTMASPAFEAERDVADRMVAVETFMRGWSPFSWVFNLTQQPAASIPCGFTRDGLPIGLQIAGPKYADALVLRASRAFESVHPIKLPDVRRLA